MSRSPDLGDMWKYGCPKGPDWDSEIGDEVDDGVEEKKESEYDVWNVRYVLEDSFLGISTGRCFVYAHDSRKVEHRGVVRAVC